MTQTKKALILRYQKGLRKLRSFTISGKFSKILSSGFSKIFRKKTGKAFFGLIILFLIFSLGRVTSPFLFRSSHHEDLSFFTGCILEVWPRETKSEFLDACLDSPGFSFKTASEPPLAQENQFLFSAPPFIVKSEALGSLSLSEEEEDKAEKKEIFEYTVKEGDTLSGIAISFDISLQTLVWANEIGEKSVVQPGQKLVILPVSGVYHMVKNGDTLSQIAKTYEGKLEEIITFNELSEESDISIGDLLIIPGGKPPQKAAPISEPRPLAYSYFICPVSSPYRITQGLHWHNAIDLAHTDISCGKPVFAAAGGEVLKTKYGYNRGAGNYIHILHPNGVVTHYGHLQSILVSPGQKVSQGEMIGLIGNTGYTIPSGPQGCHLHFEVRGARNPFAK